MRSIEDADVSGKRVVVRCDFDVPIKNGEIEDDTRIDNNIPTLKYLLEKGAKLFLISKLGRPKSKDPNLSLKHVIGAVSQKLSREVKFKEDLDENIPGDVTLLENLRFWPEEEAGDLEFSKKLASFGQLYVNECFATSHRTDASFVGIPKYLPSYAGLNLIKEIEELKKMLEHPARPLVSIIGGAKIETKMPVIDNLAKVSDTVLVGGKLMFEVDLAYLPENVLVAHDNVDKKDIGPKSAKMFREYIAEAKTVIWNGPMGVFEEEKYLEGTKQLAQAVASSDCYSVIGGGDTIAALDKLRLIDKIDFVSSGGGAMLEFLAGKELPGIKALEESS